MPSSQVRVLTLNKSESRQHVLYRLEKGWSLHFVLGPSLHACESIRIFCNHPFNSSTRYSRNTFYELEWQSQTTTKSDLHDVFAQVQIVIAGSFNYFFTIDGSDKPENANGEGYFIVDPTLSVGYEDDEITLDCIQCQSVLAKCLGPLDEWEGRLRVAKETGYNIVHITPIQELGQSNSSYSIRDQLKLNPIFSRSLKVYDFDDVENLVGKMKNEWKVLAMTDLVFNHTADDSPWLQQHPECAYNLENTPHLKPAFILDRIFQHFSQEVASEKWVSKGIPAKINSESHLHAIQHVLMTEVIPQHMLHEFYTVDIEDTLKSFKKGIQDNRTVSVKPSQRLTIIQDPEFRRNKSRVDMDAVFYYFNTDRPGVFSREERIRVCCEDLKRTLTELNEARIAEISGHIQVAVTNYVANAKWRFVNPDGEKLGTVTMKEPLMHSYFVFPAKLVGSLEKEEKAVFSDNAKFIMASNGWVLGDNPLRNFAEAGSNVYLRRELIVWGDSVKLRYGNTEADCPYLWQRMRDYTITTVRIFHAIRLDNCHSTPIHVAEYMLDAARQIRPDLYVVAELFTGGEHLDNIFMNRLGINSLIREGLNAWDAHELGRLVHRFGGLPVGSFIQPRVRPLVPSVAHALLFDQTHDNPCPIEKRSAYDCFASSALISMACCASGSNRGYDQLVPHHIHVVDENRKYTSWADWDMPDTPYINATFSITRGKTLLNTLHYELGRNGFNQVYVDQMDRDVVSVTRHNPQTHESVVLVARTAFSKPFNPEETGYVRPITIQGKVVEILFEGSVHHTDAYKYVKNPEYINGLPDYFLDLQPRIPIQESKMVDVETADDTETSNITFKRFTPGSVIAFRSTLPTVSHKAILDIRRGISQFGYLMRSYSGKTVFDETWDKSNFRAIVSHLTLAELNIVLYRCDPEEKADGNGFGAYHVPGVSDMVYCGLRGVMSMLADIRPNNDLGHPLCKNLRDGDWLPQYIAKRLKVHSGTVADLGKWFEEITTHLSHAPRYLIPCYFDAIVTGAYVVLREQALSLMSEFVHDGSTFVQALALGSIQLCGFVKNAKLPPLAPDLAPPKPSTIEIEEGKEVEACLTLAAGFPHFASGFMRNWGRDTFIALRGLLLLTGRFQEARYIILGYAGCLRHGLIPNLLNEGTGARYNCRDAVWWWMQSIQDYCTMVPDGIAILQDKVARLYPTDDIEPQIEGETVQPLHDVIQEALQHHAQGCCFRERNAGPSIDQNMSDKGFNVEYGVKWDTGFVYGGNDMNCGTWMDKMGSSAKAGNKGKPATPRDGSAVELVGLSASALKWLHKLHSDGKYPYSSVTVSYNDTRKMMTFLEWREKIHQNFEKCFWVHHTPQSGEETPELIARRGIYKDSYWATQFWANFQLRPNFLVAMVVAPDLFTPENAWTALNMAQEVLLGPLGMKTLDPSDWSYAGDYNNANDSGDSKVANGFNYHMGPEWIWPIGYFFRAKLYFAKVLDRKCPGMLRETLGFIKTRLSRHYEEVMKSPWQSLPELTNSDGTFCHDSCPAQAWSVASILEVLHDLEHIDDRPGLARTKSEEQLVAPV
ncbi:hypothetical protein CHS0354_009632 [Potamilus streckersoni]|uniref:Glycogen debranching enzyme n=1 Tax=Potamilus streckersoni TaxID=2493646 RepID=A0AAE0S4J8_9BIVA|nr:hypothetical protein CHS0354_009632 [Potamilus streckersoni]